MTVNIIPEAELMKRINMAETALWESLTQMVLSCLESGYYKRVIRRVVNNAILQYKTEKKK